MGFCLGGFGLFPKPQYYVHDNLVDTVPAKPLGCYASVVECDSVRHTLNSIKTPHGADTAVCIGIGE